MHPRAKRRPSTTNASFISGFSVVSPSYLERKAPLDLVEISIRKSKGGAREVDGAVAFLKPPLFPLLSMYRLNTRKSVVGSASHSPLKGPAPSCFEADVLTNEMGDGKATNVRDPTCSRFARISLASCHDPRFPGPFLAWISLPGLERKRIAEAFDDQQAH